ncbi:MAG: AAA family ATPase [Alphaproteobacteria bacterium]|nr:AAA family ATPase [Alphaproteobacteria bacterium]
MSDGYTIVVGNEKGGSGKTTTAMHVAVALMRMGFRVATFDLDRRQRSLTRYINNRETAVRRSGVALPQSTHWDPLVFAISDGSSRPEEQLAIALQQARDGHDFVVADCPGNDTLLARQAHMMADLLVTPINDSLVDLDVLAELDGETYRAGRPGIYARTVWEQRQLRLEHTHKGLDWVVLRNRLSNLADRNKLMMAEVLKDLSGELGFRVAAGFAERVVYRQLFLAGLTVMDLDEPAFAVEPTKSYVAARDEMRELIRFLWLPGLDGRLERI